jgi:glycosyltransferase involved in cell wall biosynthesis
MWRYRDALTTFAERWGLRTSELIFTGHLPWDELLACYDMADVFISMSEHEGFCVPLVESMLLEVPVVAYAAGAVPDTLGEAGVLFYEKNLEEMAEMAHRLGTDQAMREAVVEAQNLRVERFRPERVEAELLGYVEEVFR